MSIRDFTDGQLEEELERREATLAKPAPISATEFDYDRLLILRALAISYVDGLATNGRPPKDAEHYMFEQAMEIVYGPEVWEFVNHILR